MNNISNNNKIKRISNANGIYTPNQLDLTSYMHRFGYMNPYTLVTTPKEYVFFTKPDLHLFDSSMGLNKEIANDPFFIECLSKNYDSLRSLQKSYSDTPPGPFINLIYNHIKSNLDVPAITSEDSESAANIYGTSITYMRSSEKSDEKHDFSLEFDDNDNLELYMLFKIWDEYERRKDLGLISPPNSSYIENKILHDQVSAYKFIVGDDAESIIYYAKFTGVFPKSVPREVFSGMAKDADLAYSVNFHCEFVSDMNPLILVEFNNLVNSYKNSFKKDIDVYDKELDCINGQFVHVPYVYINNSGRHLLRWR